MIGNAQVVLRELSKVTLRYLLKKQRTEGELFRCVINFENHLDSLLCFGIVARLSKVALCCFIKEKDGRR